MADRRSLIEKPHVPGVYQEPEAGSDPLGPFIRGLLGDQDPGSLSGAAGATAGLLPLGRLLKALGLGRGAVRVPAGFPDLPPSRMNAGAMNEFAPVQMAESDPIFDAMIAGAKKPVDPARPSPPKPVERKKPKNPADRDLREHKDAPTRKVK